MFRFHVYIIQDLLTPSLKQYTSDIQYLSIFGDLRNILCLKNIKEDCFVIIHIIVKRESHLLLPVTLHAEYLIAKLA